jgi:hypothetical protein
VLSNNSEDWYVRTGRPAADLPRTREPSTLRARNVAAEVAALAARFPTVVQAYRPGFFDAIDLRTLPCATVGATRAGADLDGFQLAVVDLRGCA